MSSLTQRGIRFAKTGLELPEGLAYEDWLEAGRQLAGEANEIAWKVGDWLFFGQWEYGQKYEEGAEALGLGYQTLRNYASVAGRFELSRRRDKLSFSHHAEVAALEAAIADRWLDQAEAEGWTRAELREALRGPEPDPSPRVIPPELTAAAAAAYHVPAGDAELVRTDDIVFRATERSLEMEIPVNSDACSRWAGAAEAAGQGLDQWIVEALDAAALP